MTRDDPDPFDHGATVVRWRLVPGAVAICVARAWSLEVERVEEVEREAVGASDTYRLTAAGARYVLQCRRTHDAETERCLQRLAGSARARGCPIPRALPSSSRDVVFEAEGRAWTLSEYVEGEHFDGSRRDLCTAAKLLARFHRALEHLPDDLFADLVRLRGEIYSADRDELTRIQGRIVGDCEFDRLARLACEALTRPAAVVPEGLPRHAGHYDLHPHNLIFDPTTRRPLAMLDLGLAKVSERARDVALALHKLSRVYGERTERSQDPGATLRERGAVFLQAYQAINPLTAAEVLALPALAADEARRKIQHLLSRHYLADETSADGDLEKQITQLREASELEVASGVRS